MRKHVLITFIALSLVAVGTVYAQRGGGGQGGGNTPPKVDVGKKHPNLEAAQKLCLQAWDKIVAAQKANEFDMGGHAQKAKDLLDQVNKEIKLAAEAANK